MTSLLLPTPGRTLERYSLREPVAWSPPESPARSRTAYAAAHVVADPMGRAILDWEATLAVRRHLWSYGLRVADAMDTAQRGMGLDWKTTVELIHRTAAQAPDPALLACGAGTDHIEEPPDLPAVEAAYAEQIAVVEDAGATVVLMASRALSKIAKGPGDYHEVYSSLLRQARGPVILHWLGEAFDPRLTGYWGSRDPAEATETVLALIGEHAAKIDGIKVSVLNADHERSLRAGLPPGVRLYTGDDFSYPELIKTGSDALLGIFDGIAPAAAAALHALDDGDHDRYDALLAPTVPLARLIFSEPTYNYKTGLVFLAWLAGLQDAFVMVGGLQNARPITHLAEVFRLADAAGLLPDPPQAARRMSALLATYGIDAAGPA